MSNTLKAFINIVNNHKRYVKILLKHKKKETYVSM